MSSWWKWCLILFIEVVERESERRSLYCSSQISASDQKAEDAGWGPIDRKPWQCSPWGAKWGEFSKGSHLAVNMVITQESKRQHTVSDVCRIQITHALMSLTRLVNPVSSNPNGLTVLFTKSCSGRKSRCTWWWRFHQQRNPGPPLILQVKEISGLFQRSPICLTHAHTHSHMGAHAHIAWSERLHAQPVCQPIFLHQAKYYHDIRRDKAGKELLLLDVVLGFWNQTKHNPHSCTQSRKVCKNVGFGRTPNCKKPKT